ncbi:hypothetical protein G5B47_07770 [Paenibacillus sp. 7124]|uniref:DUF4309 domain-containing protein n=1 Tax=Paenibacillus apii TaxID=1850370 RepID=A0A6M1PPT8_9BACL|nr:hypothetical protein [Paenibacillus apii]NGM82311.1 hypothetical protein [Paenibacillus apii]NJJ39448.1 hypothetical protein [Paenibacillus apii]
MNHPKGNKCLHGVFVLIAACFILWLVPTHSEAAAEGKNRIAAEELKRISRLSFTLRDAFQTPYTVYIFASDEKMSTLEEQDYWTNNKVGDKSYTGTYRAALLKNGEQYGIVQSVNLELREITMPQTWHYTVKGSGASMPDMLILSEWGSSNFNLAHPFIIRSGVLQPLKFMNNNGKKMDDYYPASRRDGIRILSKSRVQFKAYDNSKTKYAVNTFKLNISKLELRLDDTRYVEQAAWPNSGSGDRDYLNSLKSAAFSGYLPANPQIKLGMTFKSVKDKLNAAKLKENGEWGAFYLFDHYAVGFNDYLHDLNANSHVMIFNIFADQRNLTPSNVKRWLGNPGEEYFNEEEGGYELDYKVGNHSLGFHYEEEYGFIQLITIY